MNDYTNKALQHQNYSRIMIVDDERDLLFVYKKALEIDGIEISTFDNPDMALQEFKENSETYSLILTDMRMPGMNGYQLIDKVKAIKPEIKIILISAYNITQDQIIQNLRTATKIDRFISKPITLEHLRNIIKEYV